MRLQRLGASTRILAGFACLLACGLVIAGFGAWGIGATSARGEAAMGASRTFQHVLDARLELERATNALLAPRQEIDPALPAAFARARQRLAVLAQGTGTGDPIRDMLAELPALDAAAASRFDLAAQIAAGRDSLGRLGAQAEREAAGLARETPPQWQASHALLLRVAQEAAETRRADAQFQATHDPTAIAEFHLQIDRAIEDLRSLQAPNDATPMRAAGPAADLLGGYRGAFDGMSAAVQRLDEVYDRKLKPLLVSLAARLDGGRSAADTAAQEEALRFRQAGEATTTRLWIVESLFLLGGAVLAWLAWRGVAGQWGALAGASAALSAGGRDVAVPGTEDGGAPGDVARALVLIDGRLSKLIQDGAEQDTQRAARKRRQDALARQTSTFSGAVGGAMTELTRAAAQMGRAAESMASSTATVHSEAARTAQGAGKSSSDLTAVSAAVEEFTASVGEISRQVAVASDIAVRAVDRATASRAIIDNLSGSTAKIGAVIDLIDAIAGQTNLLALNATIEAARAGDAGKGFAVVAGEVKALASQTARATADIGEQIALVREATQEAIHSMSEIGEVIGQMGATASAIATAVEQQSATTREIAASIQGVASASVEAARAMDNVVQVSDAAGAASREISSGAADIGSHAQKMRGEIDRFVALLRQDAA